MVASHIDMISVIFINGKLLKLHAPVSIHATSISPWRVELHHLKPVLPKKKGDWIVVISRVHQGVVTEVIACKTKALKAEVVINGAKVVLNFSDICCLTKPD